MPDRRQVKHRRGSAKSVDAQARGYSCATDRAGGGGELSGTSKAAYRGLSMAASIAGGLLASAVFNQVWKRVSESEEPPDPKDLGQSSREVISAAALQGLVFGVVRAVVDRAAARGYHAVTQESPE